MARPVGVLLCVLVLVLAACSEVSPPEAAATAREEALLQAAAATELFFSEYVEGTSNNKALEIYNGTGVDVDLAAGGYNLQMFFNGNPASGLTINLTGTVAAGDVHVVAHSSAAAEILAVADQTNGSGWFNGDDAVVLRKGTEVVDSIGQIGFDPGTQWGADLVSTADNTLRRKAEVTAGDTDATDEFDPSVQWEGFATDTFGGLGSHGGDDGGGGGDDDPVTCTEQVELTLISAVQGAGASSPLAGTVVTVEGVVVGDFQPGDGDEFGTNLRGYFVQEEDADADGDPATSEGIFVFDDTSDVAVGDLVRVTGRAAEFNGMTQLSGSPTAVVCDTGVDLPTATEITLPVDAIEDLEAFEGMRVTFPQALVIAEYFNFDRFGEIVLTAPVDLPAPSGAEGDGRPYQPTSYLEPTQAGDIAAALDLIARSRITLDDGRSSQNPDPARHPNGAEFDLDNLFRGGDTVTDVTGVLHFDFGLYRVQPTQGATHTAANPRPETPDDVGGSVRAAAFNVLNYFVRLTNAGAVCGPDADEECRGADTEQELERQRAKIVAALATMDAHVVGLIEIENDRDQAALMDLVGALNDATAPGTYASVDTGGPVGTDVIKVALIYQPAFLTPVGGPAILDDPEFLDPNDTGEDRNRAALAQTFEDANGGRFTVVVNHLKSKGSGCGAGDDDPLQGNCNATRLEAVQVLLDWLATDPTGSGDPDVLLVGDYNAYDREDPVRALQDAGYVDLLREYEGEGAYTYVFDGQLGYLDYALSSASLTPQVTGATAWHINADEVDLIDYDMSFKQTAQDQLYAPDPFRSSDHDPVIVGLDLQAPPLCAEATSSVTRLWPANNRLVAGTLTVLDSNGEAVAVTIDSIFQDEPVSSGGPLGPDAVISEDGRFELRAERDGEGNGRVYHVSFTASDATGSCSGVVTVSVPLSQGSDGAAVDDGPLYDSTQP